MANYLTTDTELTSVADAIRAKGGTSAQLTYPTEFVTAIQAIPTGGGSDTLTQLIANEVTSYTNSDAATLQPYLFDHKTNLEEAHFPWLERVSDHCFIGCTKLREATVRQNALGVANDGFHACSALTTINGLTGPIYSVGQYAFSGCSNLVHEFKFQEITGQTTSIGLRAFEECSNITIYDGYLWVAGGIGGLAFKNCASLGPKLRVKAVSIGTSTSANASGSFEGCTGIEAIWFKKSSSYGGGNLKIYAGTAASGKCPFWNCTNLKVICTDASAKLSDWGTYYNYIDASTTVPVKFNVSEETFMNSTIAELLAL